MFINFETSIYFFILMCEVFQDVLNVGECNKSMHECSLVTNQRMTIPFRKGQ